ncbi:hypothetical protein MNV49_005877 [Pseudohyphozyma bogoriensis]|nr:hypothetical protein MNV49_005877 [Pseudohyphozyma bogoriensis]
MMSATLVNKAYSNDGQLGMRVDCDDGDSLFVSLAVLAALLAAPRVTLLNQETTRVAPEATTSTLAYPSFPSSFTTTPGAPLRRHSDNPLARPHPTTHTTFAPPPPVPRTLRYQPYEVPPHRRTSLVARSDASGPDSRRSSADHSQQDEPSPPPPEHTSIHPSFSYRLPSVLTPAVGGSQRSPPASEQQQQQAQREFPPFPSTTRTRPIGMLHMPHEVRSQQEKQSMDEFRDKHLGPDRLAHPGPGNKASLETLTAEEPLDFIWAPRLGRCVAPDSSMAKSEQTIKVTVPAGQWVRVWEGSLQIYPWTANGNGWIKGQVKGKQGCVCGFSFTKGGRDRDQFKRPSVIREHISRCHRLPPDDPLAAICRFTREADKAIRLRSSQQASNSQVYSVLS